MITDREYTAHEINALGVLMDQYMAEAEDVTVKALAICLRSRDRTPTDEEQATIQRLHKECTEAIAKAEAISGIIEKWAGEHVDQLNE